MVKPFHSFTVHNTNHGQNLQNILLRNFVSDYRKGDVQLRGLQNPHNRSDKRA